MRQVADLHAAATRDVKVICLRLEHKDVGPRIVFTVPSVAVGEDDAGRYVFVLEPQAEDLYIARRRGVEVGNLTQAARFVVSDGLGEGELIATAGVRRIQDGQTVRLANGLRS